MYQKNFKTFHNKRQRPTIYYTKDIVLTRKELHEEYKFYLKMLRVLNEKQKLKKEVERILNSIECKFNGLEEQAKPPISKK